MKCQILLVLAAVIVGGSGAPQHRFWPLQFIYTAGKPGEKLSLDAGGVEAAPISPSNIPVEVEVPVPDTPAQLQIDEASVSSLTEPIKPEEQPIQVDSATQKLRALATLWRAATENAADIPTLFSFLSTLTAESGNTEPQEKLMQSEQPIPQNVQEESVFVEVPNAEANVEETPEVPNAEANVEETPTTENSIIEEAPQSQITAEQPILEESLPVTIEEQILKQSVPEEQSIVEQSIPNTFEQPIDDQAFELRKSVSFEPKRSSSKSKLRRFNEQTVKKGKTLISDIPQEPLPQETPFEAPAFVFPSYSYSFRHVPVNHGRK